MPERMRQWLHLIAPWLREAAAFLRYLVERFLRDQCPESAATLAYTTLLSLVPLLTVIVSVLSAFPVFDAISGQLRGIVLGNFVPSFGATVEDYLARFVDRAAGLTLAGALGVFLSALLMISAIDRALNRIWHVHKRRRPFQGFMVYWTVLTLSPVLLGASVAVSSYLLTVSRLVDLEAPGPVAAAVLRALPFIAEVGAFLFLYMAVPNRRVRVRHALGGAIVAALLFEAAKAGFALYVRMVPGFEAIYGALATIPLFLIWLYVCWLIILLGAEWTQALGAYKAGRAGPLAGERHRLVAALRILGRLWQAQQHGTTLGRRELVRAEPRIGDRGLQAIMDILESVRLVQKTSRGRWVLSRDLAGFTLLELFRAHPFTLPLDHRALDPNDPWDRAIGERLDAAAGALTEAFDVPLSRLLAAPVDEAREQGQAGSGGS
ncbi:virulence factor BrkB family protein [Ectothiorhodospiraceae bacterium WFHF3C12]|nr:virulence factor BrkB family protein [Ectothiorhodospiraceae bacterium WFHF3C12]